ncbi:MAG TPA: hypothetical protein VMJ12_05890 [Candidatus Acidoferrales bacterium]|nr:hypothetical protein [Candidatus Acidoferrales bacterium]
MNPELTNERPVWHVGLGFIVASLLFAALILVLKFSVPPPAIDADRAALRSKALAQIRASEAQALDNAGWLDQQRGLVRLPINVAMQMAAREWQNPAEARTNLIAREEKATAPAPVAPAKPNAFE